MKLVENMNEDDKEKKIQKALELNAHKWDEKYSQQGWSTKPSSNPKKGKSHRRGKTPSWVIAKAMKNVW